MAEDAQEAEHRPQIIILDSPEALEAAQRLFPSLAAVYVNGEADLSAFDGRKCVLMPTAGRVAAARALAARLFIHAAEVKICPPEPTRPSGWSIAAEPDWTNDQAGPWAMSVREIIQLPAPQGADAAMPGPVEPESPPPDGSHDQSPAEAGLPPPDDAPPIGSLTPPRDRKRRKRPDLSLVDGNLARAPDPDDEILPHELSESGIAAQFVALHKDKFRTVHEWAGKQGACWMAWDGSRWRREPSRVSAMQQGQILAIAVKYWEAAKGVSEPSKVKFESRKFIGAFLDLASYAPEFVTSPAEFDAFPMLLGTPGGTVDLCTGKLCEPDPAQFLTRQTSVTPARGPHPLFDNVIERMCVGDESMRGYIMRALGYSICADQREEVFWFLHGKPQSGKSTLIKAVAEILGNAEDGGYAATFDMELFTEQRNDKGSERMAHLHGARFAWASETEEGKNFKTALLKLATGGDKLSGRFLYQEKFSFEPTHHLWLFGNERIHLKSADAGIKRRLHMIEYPGVIAEDERDNTLKERLKAEYPAILHTLIMGCIDWQLCGGLGKPEQISVAVDSYMDAEDEVSAWIDECAERGEHRTPIGDAFRSFSEWAEKNGAYLISAKRFSGELEKRGFDRTRSAGVRYISGLGIKLGANL